MNWWIYRREVHVSWLVALLAAGVVIGVICVQFLPLGLFGNISWLIVGLVLAGFSVWQRKLFIVPIICCCGIPALSLHYFRERECPTSPFQ